MNKLDIFTRKFLSHNKTIAFLGMVAILSLLMGCLTIKDNQLVSVLQNVALINITIAIGLGAISISLKQDEKTFDFLKEIVLIMIISILSYFLTFWGQSIILRGYLFFVGLSIVSILISIARSIEELNREKNN